MLTINRLRWFTVAFWALLVASTVAGAEPTIVAVGSKELELTLKALLSDKVDSSLLDMPADKAGAELANQWLGTVLSARLTILEKHHADSMIVERLQHQGASIVVIEHSAHQQSTVGMLKRLRAIYRALVERFPEHELQLKYALQAQIRKHRSQRVLNRPQEAHLADSISPLWMRELKPNLQRTACFLGFVAGGSQ